MFVLKKKRKVAGVVTSYGKTWSVSHKIFLILSEVQPVEIIRLARNHQTNWLRTVTFIFMHPKHIPAHSKIHTVKFVEETQNSQEKKTA